MGKTSRKKKKPLEGKKTKPLLEKSIFTRVVITFLLASISIFLTYKRNLMWIDEITLWGDVVKKSPENGRGYVNLGIGYENSNIERALGIYQQAVFAANDNFYVHFRLAQVYEKMGLDDLAIKEYEEGLDPTKIYNMPKSSYADAYMEFAFLLQKKRFIDRAIINYQKAVDANPNSLTAYKAHNNIGAIYGSQNLFEKAVKEFQSAKKIDPTLPDAYNNLGIEYAKEGMFRAAIHEFITAIRLEPNDAEYHFNLGLAYKEIGQKDSAKKELKEALKIRPDFVNALREIESF